MTKMVLAKEHSLAANFVWLTYFRRLPDILKGRGVERNSVAGIEFCIKNRIAQCSNGFRRNKGDQDVHGARVAIGAVVIAVIPVGLFLGIFGVAEVFLFGAAIFGFCFLLAALLGILRKNDLFWQYKNTQTEN